MGGGSSKRSYQETIQEQLRVRGAALLPLPCGGQLIDESQVEPCPNGHHAIRSMPNVVFSSGKETITVKGFFCQKDLTQYIYGTEVCGEPCTDPKCPSAQLPKDSPNRFLCFHTFGHNTTQTAHCCVNCPNRNGTIGYVRMPFTLLMQDTAEYYQQVIDNTKKDLAYQQQSLNLAKSITATLTGTGPLNSEQLDQLRSQQQQLKQLANQQQTVLDQRAVQIIPATIPFTELFLHIRTFDLTNQKLTTIQIEEKRKRGLFSSSRSRNEQIVVLDDASKKEILISIPVTAAHDRIYLSIDRQIYQEGVVSVISKSPGNQIQLVNSLSTEDLPGYISSIVDYRNRTPCERGQHMGALLPASAMLYQYYQRILHVNGNLRDQVEHQLGAKVSVISCVLCGQSTCLLFNSTVLKNLPTIITNMIASQKNVSIALH